MSIKVYHSQMSSVFQARSAQLIGGVAAIAVLCLLVAGTVFSWSSGALSLAPPHSASVDGLWRVVGFKDAGQTLPDKQAANIAASSNRPVPGTIFRITIIDNTLCIVNRQNDHVPQDCEEISSQEPSKVQLGQWSSLNLPKDAKFYVNGSPPDGYIKYFIVQPAQNELLVPTPYCEGVNLSSNCRIIEEVWARDSN